MGHRPSNRQTSNLGPRSTSIAGVEGYFDSWFLHRSFVLEWFVVLGQTGVTRRHAGSCGKLSPADTQPTVDVDASMFLLRWFHTKINILTPVASTFAGSSAQIGRQPSVLPITISPNFVLRHNEISRKPENVVDSSELTYLINSCMVRRILCHSVSKPSLCLRVRPVCSRVLPSSPTHTAKEFSSCQPPIIRP